MRFEGIVLEKARGRKREDEKTRSLPLHGKDLEMLCHTTRPVEA